MFFSQKKKFEIFLLEKFPIFPIRNIPKDVFQTLLWGAETIRKKYRVVFEIFSKRLFFLTSKVASVSHPLSTTTTTTFHAIQQNEVSKKPILVGNLKCKKLFLGDIRPKEIKLGPRREPSKECFYLRGIKNNT